MRYFSMFSGIGGFELGIQNAYRSKIRGSQTDSQKDKKQRLFTTQGKSISSTQRLPSKCFTNELNQRPLCVGYSEIDNYAIKVYERHFGGHKNYGDATKINPAKLPDFELLVGGFPCQSFSIAGKRKGFDDTRGTLFFDIARILAKKRPRHLVLENVKGLLSHEQGKTFQTILGVLTDLGYRVEWQVLNSKDFGVPQNRERVFIVGHLGGKRSGQVFPITGTNRQDIKQINQPKHSNDRIYSDKGISPTLNTMQGGNRQPFVAAQRGRENGQVLEPQTEDKTNTLTAVAKDNYVVDMPRIRRLTPTECERLQGFPKDWTKYGLIVGGTDPELDSFEVSDTQRYKMCGNAVTTNVVQAVIELLL